MWASPSSDSSLSRSVNSGNSAEILGFFVKEGPSGKIGLCGGDKDARDGRSSEEEYRVLLDGWWEFSCVLLLRSEKAEERVLNVR